MPGQLKMFHSCAYKLTELKNIIYNFCDALTWNIQ